MGHVVEQQKRDSNGSLERQNLILPQCGTHQAHLTRGPHCVLAQNGPIGEA